MSAHRAQRLGQVVHAPAHESPVIIELEAEDGAFFAFMRELDLAGQDLLGRVVHPAFHADHDGDRNLAPGAC